MSEKKPTDSEFPTLVVTRVVPNGPTSGAETATAQGIRALNPDRKPQPETKNDQPQKSQK